MECGFQACKPSIVLVLYYKFVHCMVYYKEICLNDEEYTSFGRCLSRDSIKSKREGPYFVLLFPLICNHL